MKTFIISFIIVYMAPIISLQAQSGSNYNHHSPFQQSYYVRIVSNYGIIPTTTIEVTDNEGRSLSCKTDDIYTKKNGAKEFCKTDSLINMLETCADCKTVKSKSQMDSIRKAFSRVRAIREDCKPGYGEPVYISYIRFDGGVLKATNKKISKGCGQTAQENELISAFIQVFEHKSSEPITQINTAFAKGIKSISDSADNDFVPQVYKDSASVFYFKAMITKEGLLRCVSDATLTQIQVFFIGPQVRKWGPVNLEKKEVAPFSLTYQLRKKKGSALYDIDINDGRYRNVHKLLIVPMSDNGNKREFTIINKKVPEVVVLK